VGNDGRAISDSHNYARSQKLLRQLEQKYSLTIVKEQKQRQSLTNVPEPDRTRIALRDQVRGMVASSRSLEELGQVAKVKGIKMEVRTNEAGSPTGLRFEQNGYRFKGSELDRSLSIAQITQKLRLNHEQGQRVGKDAQLKLFPRIEENRGRGMKM